MNLSSAVRIDLSHGRHVVVGIEAAPDVTWGRGGIDDYGWTAEPPEPSSDDEGTHDA